MRLSTIIAKCENGVLKGARKVSAKTKEFRHELKIERRASRLAEGRAEEERVAIELAGAGSRLHSIDALRQAAEAAEVEQRANELLLQRERQERERAERQRREEYARRVLAGEVALPQALPVQAVDVPPQ